MIISETQEVWKQGVRKSMWFSGGKRVVILSLTPRMEYHDVSPYTSSVVVKCKMSNNVATLFTTERYIGFCEVPVLFIIYFLDNQPSTNK